MEAELSGDPFGDRLEADGPVKEAVVSGTLSDISEKNGWYTLTLSDAAVEAEGEIYAQKKVTVSGASGDLPVLSELTCGDHVRAGGTAEPFDEPRNPGAFSYRLYYRGLGIRCRLQARWLEAAPGQSSPVARQARAFRQFAGQAFSVICQERDAGVFRAVLLGDKSRLDAELRQRFEDSGIAHILAVSGLHVSLIGMSLYRVLRRLGLGYGKAGLAAGAALLFYGTAVGFGSSVFRAIFMVFCSMLAAHLGRSYDLLSAMALSLFCLAWDSPFLLFSGGLQLSYGAVAAIGLEQEIGRIRKKRRRQQEAGEARKRHGQRETGEARKRHGQQETGEARKRRGQQEAGEAQNRKNGVRAEGGMTGGRQSALAVQEGLHRFLKGLGEALAVSASIQLYTLPIVLYHFFAVPPWGIFLNLLVIPLMSYAAGSGLAALALYGAGTFCAGGAGLLENPGTLFSDAGGGRVLWFLQTAAAILEEGACAAVGPGHYIFSLYDSLCAWSQELPFASVTAGRPQLWKIAVYYLFLFWRFGREVFPRGEARTDPDGRVSERGGMGGGWTGIFGGESSGVFLCLLAVAFLLFRPVHGLEVWFLDVGQGDGVFLRTREAAILSDCGSSQDKKVGEGRLMPFLQSQGISRLDYVFVSHADQDHVNGIEWLLESGEKIEVGCLLLPAAGKGQEEYTRLETAACARGARVLYLGKGDKVEAGGLSLTCLSPQWGDRETDRNDHSLVLSVRYGLFSLLLTGDISAEREEKLVQEENFPEGTHLDVLKAAHHGSGGSSSAEFLEAVSPSVCILSYGEGNSYGHPSPEAIERLEAAGCSLWSTAASGAICIRTDGKTAKLQPFLESPPSASGPEKKP